MPFSKLVFKITLLRDAFDHAILFLFLSKVDDMPFLIYFLSDNKKTDTNKDAASFRVNISHVAVVPIIDVYDLKFNHSFIFKDVIISS